MFSPASARAASSYRKASVDGASPYQLINILFERTLQSVRSARLSIQQGDVDGKCQHIGMAVRYIEEGLKLGLNPDRNDDLANRLSSLYDYCVRQLTLGNLRSDETPVAEVQQLVEQIAEGWRGIANEAQQVRAMPSLSVGA
ncbi:flagellar export chaperone FliS [Xylophilus rhododendri]|uniref:Flagellar secretion chaperone FliS n=1 Tax=Xylophilus rhododendri TaxID=2697032 RepID=A0A857J498_9BURK|nr:flagellar export chaperone FliS [Xylophilus rhododendri]QHI97949.1 flagellar export chaperone FliS [Xylophilus rhododendri]